MKIGIDARFLTHPQPGGFKTYVENLVAALATVDTNNEYVLYLDRAPDDGCKLPSASNFASRVVPGSAPIVGMPWREQVSLARQTTRDHIEVFHAPCLTAPVNLDCTLVVTVHDMIWAFPGQFSQGGSLVAKRKFMEWYNQVVPRYATRRASVVITVSQAAKESIIQRLGLSNDRVFVTHEAANPCFRRIQDEHRLEAVRRKYELPTDFILAIGSADPRKNMSTLVKAYSLLPHELQDKHHLAIVWTHALLANGLSEKIEALGLAQRVQFLQQVPTEDLILLYNAAALFVFPSLYEGFGLPLLEAMACGVPVAAANNSSIPEVAGDAALLFDAMAPDTMANAMLQLLRANGAYRAELVQNGLKRAETFSWESCAAQTVSIYQQASSRRMGKS